MPSISTSGLVEEANVVIPRREISEDDVGFASVVVTCSPGIFPFTIWMASFVDVAMKFSEDTEAMALATSPFR